jgi:hypothetical protein
VGEEAGMNSDPESDSPLAGSDDAIDQVGVRGGGEDGGEAGESSVT